MGRKYDPNVWEATPIEERQRRSRNATAIRKAQRAEQRDGEVPLKGREKSDRIDLGLTLLHRRCIYGVPVTRDDQAKWAGCTDSLIFNIEEQALRKLRARLDKGDRRLVDLMEQYFEERRPAGRCR